MSELSFPPVNAHRHAEAGFEGPGGKIHEVDRKLPNRWGFYDMLGNAKEWCRDNFVPAGADTGLLPTSTT